MDQMARKAAELLWNNWTTGHSVATLPEDCRPGDIDAGYRVQEALVDVSGQKPVGYKIAASSQAGQKHLKITHPVFGRLFESQMLPSGEESNWRDNSMSVAELEFAFRIGDDLPPRSNSYEWQEVMEAVEAMHVGIELPGSRFHDAAEAGIAQIVADNASADLYVLGPSAPSGWRALDLANCAARMLIDGVEKTAGTGRDVLGDPRFSLTWLINQLSQKGLAMEKGQLVTTGVCGLPLPVFKGQHIVGDFGEIGEVSVTLV